MLANLYCSAPEREYVPFSKNCHVLWGSLGTVSLSVSELAMLPPRTWITFGCLAMTIYELGFKLQSCANDDSNEAGDVCV